MGKKIVVVLDSEPKWGGEHRYALMLVECLIKTEGMEPVAVCGSQYWKKWCREHAVRVLDTPYPRLTADEQKWHVRHALYSWVYMTYMTEFGAMLRREKVDAVLCTVQGNFVPDFGVKVIVPVHDLMHRYEGRFPEVAADYEARELMFSSKARYAWCVLTDSRTGTRQFRESYTNCMKKRKPRVVSLPFVAPGHITECVEEVTDTPEKYIFYPAQFWQHKNHMNLLKAVGLLVGELPDIYLILVGAEKNNLKNVMRYISENGLMGHVTIKGFVSDVNLKYLYRHAVGMIMPSYFGPTNIPPLEAMALGCPTAVSDKYAMPEQVGDAGLLFDPDSPEEMAACIRKLWTDEELRKNLVRKGYKRIKRWTEESFDRRFRGILNEI